MKVSIITVCFNSAATIRDTIESVRTQDYPEIEYIIVDGKSTDDTLEIIKEYEDSISVLISEKDEGVYDGMNKGIAAATGDIIGFLNADDYLASHNTIRLIADKFINNSLDVCYGDLHFVDKLNTDRVTRVWKPMKFNPQLLNKGWIPPHPSFYAKRKLLAEGFDLKYRIASDYDLILGILSQRGLTVGYLPTVLVKMRTGGISNGSWRTLIKQNLEIWDAAKKRGITLSPLRWFGRKLFDRMNQLLKANNT